MALTARLTSLRSQQRRLQDQLTGGRGGAAELRERGGQRQARRNGADAEDGAHGQHVAKGQRRGRGAAPDDTAPHAEPAASAGEGKVEPGSRADPAAAARVQAQLRSLQAEARDVRGELQGLGPPAVPPPPPPSDRPGDPQASREGGAGKPRRGDSRGEAKRVERYAIEVPELLPPHKLPPAVLVPFLLAMARRLEVPQTAAATPLPRIAEGGGAGGGTGGPESEGSGTEAEGAAGLRAQSVAELAAAALADRLKDLSPHEALVVSLGDEA